MVVRSGLEKQVFRKYHRKWTEKQIKPPPRFWRIRFSSSAYLARDMRSPLLSHAALPPGRFHSVGSQRPATSGLGPLGVPCRSHVVQLPEESIRCRPGAECTKPPKRLSLLHRPKDYVQTVRCFATAVRQEGRPGPVGGSLLRSSDWNLQGLFM